MRDIKFRAWCKKHKVMIYHIGSISWNEENNIFVNQDTRCAGNEILMQYTGLKDKKGKEIYEGDVVKYFKRHLGVVKFIKGCFVVDGANGYDTFDDLGGEIEVKGNIYENPNLLEGNQ